MEFEDVIEAAEAFGIGDILKQIAGVEPDPEPNFWRDNKNWLVPTGIGMGALTIIGVAAVATKK